MLHWVDRIPYCTLYDKHREENILNDLVRNLREILKIVLRKFDVAGESYFDCLLSRHIFTKYTNIAEDVEKNINTEQ